MLFKDNTYIVNVDRRADLMNTKFRITVISMGDRVGDVITQRTSNRLVSFGFLKLGDRYVCVNYITHYNFCA